MFDEAIQPDIVNGALARQDIEAIKNFWSQSLELQEDIARELYIITDGNVAEDLFEFLSARYEKADADEKLRIIDAFESLGARYLPVEIKTTSALVNNYNEANSRDTIRVLKRKMDRATISRKPERLTPRLPIINTAGQLFLDELAKTDCPHDLKLQILAGVYACQYHPDLLDRTSQTLERYAISADEEESLFALGEMISMPKYDHRLITQRIINKFESGWIENASDEEISKIITIAGHNGDPNLRSYLVKIQKNRRFETNQDIQQNIDSALSRIPLKELDEI